MQAEWGKTIMKKSTSTMLLLISLIFFVVGSYCVYQGFDKKDNYYQSEYSWDSNVNVYVGGDAYNYIINGTYFAGYCALGGAMFICGTITGVGGLVGRVKKPPLPEKPKTDCTEVL